LLDELLPDIGEWTLHLLGTDINIPLLSKALRGRYRQWSLRATPDQVREDYFTRVGQKYELIKKIRQRAVFTYSNLTQAPYPSLLTGTDALDLILCRNVLIYLQREAAQAIMNQFASCLVPEGALFLGASDLRKVETPGLTLQQGGETFYYQHACPPQAMVPTDKGGGPRDGVAKVIVPATGLEQRDEP